MSVPEEGLRDILAGATPFVPADSVSKPEPAPVAAPEPAATPEPAKAEPKAEEAKPEETKEAPRDDKGRFQKTVPHEALHAEKQKRQALERELAQLREQSKTAEPKVSVLEDEDKAFSQRMSEAVRPLQEKLYTLSVKAARAVPGRDDFDDATAAFVEAANADPRLYEAWRAADDPGEYAYTVGRQIRELADVGGDVVAYGEKKAATVRAELEEARAQIKALNAELEAAKKREAEISAAPRSLNNAPSPGTPRSVAEADDEDISKIVRFNTRG